MVGTIGLGAIAPWPQFAEYLGQGLLIIVNTGLDCLFHIPEACFDLQGNGLCLQKSKQSDNGQ